MVNYKQMWRDFEEIYRQQPNGFKVGFMIGKDSKPIAVRKFLEYPRGFGVELKKKIGFPLMMANQLFDTLLKFGLKSSSIDTIEAFYDGNMYSLVDYSTKVNRDGCLFMFHFGDQNKNVLFSEEDDSVEDEPKN